MRKNESKKLSPLARHRLARGWNQRDLARKLEVNPSTVNAWESGKFRPEAHRVPELANLLGVTPMRVTELLDRE